MSTKLASPARHAPPPPIDLDVPNKVLARAMGVSLSTARRRLVDGFPELDRVRRVANSRLLSPEQRLAVKRLAIGDPCYCPTPAPAREELDANRDGRVDDRDAAILEARAVRSIAGATVDPARAVEQYDAAQRDLAAARAVRTRAV